jgi:hypothetical protein
VIAVRMRRLSTLIAVVVVVATFAAPGFAGTRDTNPPAAYPTIYVNYAMNCTFTIVDDNKRRLTSIPPGTYQIEVSTPVMFKLVVPGGPGVDSINPNDFTGCKGWVQFRVTGPGIDLFTTLDSGCDAYQLLSAQSFKDGGTYTFQDLNQPATTRTTLSVDSSAPSWTAQTPYTKTSGKGQTFKDLIGSARLPLIGTLSANLAKTGQLSLSNKGKNVVSLKAGKYRVVVTDRSSSAGIILEPVDGNAKSLSGVKFVGKDSKAVVLTPGRWMYHTSSGKSHYFRVQVS